MLTPIEPVSIWETNGTKRRLETLEDAARFMTERWPGERHRPTYLAALKACLAALEGAGTAQQAREAMLEAASAADILAD